MAQQQTKSLAKGTAVQALTARSMQIAYKSDGKLVKLDYGTVKDVICKGQQGLTDGEVMLFMRFCQHMEANPFIGDAYLVKYKESMPAANVVGVGYHEKKADSYKEFQGIESGIIVEDEDGQEHDKTGCHLSKRETLVGGWA